MHSGMVIARIKVDFGGMQIGIEVAGRFIVYFPTEMALLSMTEQALRAGRSGVFWHLNRRARRE